MNTYNTTAAIIQGEPVWDMKGKKLTFDVMDVQTERFICTLSMPYCPLFPVTNKQVLDFVYKKRPTLKYRKIRILL